MSDSTLIAMLPACRHIHAGKQITGKQGLEYTVGISAESADSHAIHMQMLSMPPGARAKAHKHATHETAIYALSGTSHVWHGERLEHHSIVEAGDSAGAAREGRGWAVRLRMDMRPTTEARFDVAVRCVIDHAPSGRTLRRTSPTRRRTGVRRRASEAASSRRSVRSPGKIRDRTTTATSALTGPTTASARFARDVIRPRRESPSVAGYGSSKVGITAE